MSVQNQPESAAGLTTEVVALAERLWARELGSAHGYIMSLPAVTTDEDEDGGISDQCAAAEGHLLNLETATGGHGFGKDQAPQSEYSVKRFGADFPAEIRLVHEWAVAELMAAAGCPVELLVTSDGAGMRESWRRFTAATINPLGAIVADQASAKLPDPVGITFHRLRGSDVQGLARAIKSLVDAGFDRAAALEIVGIS